MKRRPAVVLAVMLAAGAWGCGGSDDDDGSGTDADTDTDTDADSDTDADTDADSDTDADADADTDSDSDTDTSTSSDSDTGSDTGGDTDSDTDTAAVACEDVSYEFDFETGPQGFTHSANTGDSSDDSWALGTPSIAGCHSGASCWATNLYGDYGLCEDSQLVSPVLDLSACLDSTLPFTLRFWHYYDLEEPWPVYCYDGGFVQISYDGGDSWNDVEPVPGYESIADTGYTCTPPAVADGHQIWCSTVPGDAWEEVVVVLDTSLLTSQVRVRFVFASDHSNNDWGWQVDDVFVGHWCEGDDDCVLVGGTCTGAGTCDLDTHRCEYSGPPPEGTYCDTDSDEDTLEICLGGECVPSQCHDGYIEPLTEDCEDMNFTSNDGCENDCTYTCSMDEECYDGDICDGDETCNLGTHVCDSGEAMVCEDYNDCTENNCESPMGCVFDVIDGDGDGHASEVLGACGSDCDDENHHIYYGAPELCDTLDNDCDGDTDEDPPNWYVDCDEDGFAESTNGAIAACDEPADPPVSCGGGGAWTTKTPTSISSTDCDDSCADAHPGQTTYFEIPIPNSTSYDYNCNGVENLRWPDDSYGCFATSGLTCYGDGWSYDVPDCGEVDTWDVCAHIMGPYGTTICGFSHYQLRTQGCR